MLKEQKPIEELLSICNATQWKDFSFELITELIASGYVGRQTDKGLNEFIPKIQGLYNFFARLEHSQKEM